MRPNRLSAAFALGLVLAGTLQPALARSGREEITPAEEREFNYDANIPGCQASEVLERLSTHFAEKERKFWNSSLTIVSYERIERTAWRPWGLDFVPRRYCSAVATTSRNWMKNGLFDARSTATWKAMSASSASSIPRSAFRIRTRPALIAATCAGAARRAASAAACGSTAMRSSLK